MHTFDRYLFWEWLKIFSMTLMATLGILLLEDIYDDLPDLIGFGASAQEIFRYYCLRAPGFLPAILPISLLVSVLFTLGRFNRNHEITAMRAAGLNIVRITRSLWVVGAAFTLILFLLNGYVVPASVEDSRNLWNRLRFANDVRNSKHDHPEVVHKFSFDNVREGRLWFMDGFSEYTYQGFGVNVYVRNGDGVEVSRIVAKEAYFDDADGHWVFINGREMTFDPKTGEPIRSLAFTEQAYPDFKETPDFMEILSKRPRDLSLSELRKILDHIDDPYSAHRYSVRYQGILVGPITCFLVVCLAIPFSIVGGRVNPMVGVSKCVGLFFLYYVVVNICRLMGEQHVLNVTLAAWLPILMVAALCLVLYRRLV